MREEIRLWWRKGSDHRRRLVVLLCLAAVVSQPAAGQEGRAAADVDFTHGVLAFQEEDYEEAARLLEKAVGFLEKADRNAPSMGTYLHWLAVTYVRLGRGAEAAERLKQSRDARHPRASGRRQVRDDLRRVRESLDRGTALPPLADPDVELTVGFPGGPPRWERELGLQAAYDSNPGLLAEELGVSVPGVAPGDVPGAAATLVDLRLDHRPLWDRRGWSLGMQVAGHGALHPNHDDTDLALGRGTLSLGWGRNPGGSVPGALGSTRTPVGEGPAVLLQGRGVYAQFGGEELLQAWEAAVTGVVRTTARSETTVAGALRDREYGGGAGTLREGGEDELSIAVGQSRSFGGRDRYLRVGLEAGDIRAERALAARFGEARVEAGRLLSVRCRLLLYAALRADRYDHPESNIGSPGGPGRSDRTWRAGIAGAWQPSAHVPFDWIARAEYVRRNSNVELPAGSPLFDYERTILALGLRWRP